MVSSYPRSEFADVAAASVPAGLVFGTSTAAYQVEAATNAEGRGVSIWDTFSHTPGRTRNGDTGNVASRHYTRRQEDLDLLAQLGAPAYRFSVAWPRIQPTGKGHASQEGIDFYRRVTDGLRARGIMAWSPCITGTCRTPAADRIATR